MDREYREIATLPLDDGAEEVIETVSEDLARILTVQAKVFAFRQKDDIVLRRHVYEAQDAISRERQRTGIKEYGIAIGSALFGAFLSGFMTELSNENPVRESWVALYVILGIVGLLMLSWGLLSRR